MLILCSTRSSSFAVVHLLFSSFCQVQFILNNCNHPGLVKDKEVGKKKPGRPPELRIEEQVLIALEYWREYRSYYHIGLDWGVSESTVCRTVHKVENILIRSRKFSLPGQKSLLNFSLDADLIVMDVKESPIERPQKHQKRFYSGKQKEHTLKTQLIIEQKT